MSRKTQRFAIVVNAMELKNGTVAPSAPTLRLALLQAYRPSEVVRAKPIADQKQIKA